MATATKPFPFVLNSVPPSVRCPSLCAVAMFSADSVHNAFMNSVRKERMAFEKAAAGAPDYKVCACVRACVCVCVCV